jgi:3-oxoacyl-[acyl-carrier protein] reductase
MEYALEVGLRGYTALVGGSTQGIGLAAAWGIAAMGGRVVLLSRNEVKLRAVCDELNKHHPADHTYAVADFTNVAAVERAAAAVIAKVGTVHILVNNTGGPPAGAITEASPDDFLSAFGMHLLSSHVLVQACVPCMKVAGYGRIINVISTSVKQPLPNLGVSNTIRGAVANWSKTMANELGSFGITVNNVLPGATATGRLQQLAEKKAAETGKDPAAIIADMGKAAPLGRVGTPREIANAIVFLASPAASYINGINLPVDGGRTSSL